MRQTWHAALGLASTLYYKVRTLLPSSHRWRRCPLFTNGVSCYRRIVDMPHSFAIVCHMVLLTISTLFLTHSTGPTVNQHARPRRRPPTDRPLPRERARPVLRGEIR